jgi:hypothetical protein
MDWIHLAQYRVRGPWRAITKTIMMLRDPKKTGNFSTSWATISFSRKTPFLGNKCTKNVEREVDCNGKGRLGHPSRCMQLPRFSGVMCSVGGGEGTFVMNSWEARRKRMTVVTRNRNCYVGLRNAMTTCSHTRVIPKVSGLAAWSENCKWYSSLPLGVVIALFCEPVQWLLPS